jgi:hypothetical protein
MPYCETYKVKIYSHCGRCYRHRFEGKPNSCENRKDIKHKIGR